MVSASVNPSQTLMKNMYNESKSEVKETDSSENSFASNLKKTSKVSKKQTDEKVTESESNDVIKNYDKAFEKIKEEMKKSKIVSGNVSEITYMPQLQIVDIAIQTDIQSNNSEIKAEIADVLGVSVSEVETVLKDMNISVYDLKDENNLKGLISEIKNIEDEFELLTNNELYSDYRKAFEEISEKLLDFETVKTVETTDVDNELVEETLIADEMLPNECNDKNTIDKEIVSDEETVFEIDGLEINQKIKENITSNNEFSSELNKNNDNQMENKDVSFVNIKNDNVVNDISDAIIEATGDVNEADVVSQIIEQVKTQVKPGISSIEMQLYPEHLGKVSIQVVSKDGIVSAEISAQTEAAKKAIEGQLTILKDNLNNQGIKVEAVEVTIAGHGFEENLERDNRNQDEASKGSKHVRKSLLDELNGIDSLDETEEVKMETIGNTVSYKA